MRGSSMSPPKLQEPNNKASCICVPGWLKRLFMDFISFTLKLILKHQVCKEINYLFQLLAVFIQDTAGNPVTIQASYVEKKLVLYLSDSEIILKVVKCAANITGNDKSLRHFLKTIIIIAGISEVISRIPDSTDGLWLPPSFAA
ncbi:cholesteryl ester transfer protein isoform C [Alligator mississippiensis]|uniref:Cholesteryl ester transfer protein isoform C n=1 Tax=Alligator mississippiensis TaxID=8496 RepID=A0A151MRJ2_ALLMI|nr:cholesteryl ester transfer protein isoform C [Alligator mississippiensis]